MSNKKQHYNIMKTNKPLTAVDWLLQQFDEEKTPRQWEEVYKQAIELEKKQITDAFKEGIAQTDEYISQEDAKIDEYIANEYYKDTYGND